MCSSIFSKISQTVGALAYGRTTVDETIYNFCWLACIFGLTSFACSKRQPARSRGLHKTQNILHGKEFATPLNRRTYACVRAYVVVGVACTL